MTPPDATDPAAARPSWFAHVEAAQRGDGQAFARLHREFGAMVHGLLLVRLDPATADDLTQDVFLQAWRRIDRLHEPLAWPAWLATIARNRALDHLRASKPVATLPPGLATTSLTRRRGSTPSGCST